MGQGEAKGWLVSPSCGKAPVKATLTLSNILLCCGTLKNKQTGFVFSPDPHLSELLAYMALLMIACDNVEVLYFHLSPLTGGKGASVAQCYLKWGDTPERKCCRFIP